MTMQILKVQQFYEVEDELYELGGTQNIEFTESEQAELELHGPSPVFITRLNGIYGLRESINGEQ